MSAIWTSVESSICASIVRVSEPRREVSFCRTARYTAHAGACERPNWSGLRWSVSLRSRFRETLWHEVKLAVNCKRIFGAEPNFKYCAKPCLNQAGTDIEWTLGFILFGWFAALAMLDLAGQTSQRNMLIVWSAVPHAGIKLS